MSGVSKRFKDELKQRFEATKSPAERCDIGNVLSAIQLSEKIDTAVEMTQEPGRWEFRFATKDAKPEEKEMVSPLSEVHTRDIVEELLTRKIYRLWELKENRLIRPYIDVSTKLDVSELLREIEMLITTDYSNYK